LDPAKFRLLVELRRSGSISAAADASASARLPSARPALGMSARVGSFAWTRETNGILRRREKLAFFAQGILYGLGTLPAESRRALGLRAKPARSIDVTALAPPDSPICREAERLVEESASAPVANHSYRTYAWGAALAARDGLRYDRELVYVASLVHDLYFEHPDALREPHCLTLPAATEGERIAREAGWSATRAREVAEAITLHANMLPPHDSDEIYLVYAGARLDTAGYRFAHLPAETVAVVLDRYPRLGMKRAWASIFAAQSRANRGSRVDVMNRYLAAAAFVRRAPFEE
jgi:hypothetical protein